jgi:hypothetical protein
MDYGKIALVIPKSTNIKPLLREVSGWDSLFAFRVNHEEWHEKHEFPVGFDEEDDEDEEEGYGSSASQSSGDSAKDSNYRASRDEKPESSG